MNKLLLIIIFSIMIFTSYGQQMEEHEQLTRQFIRHLESSQFTEAEDMFNEQVLQMISGTQLQNIWGGVLQQMGPFQSVEEIVFENMGETVIARARAVFGTSPVILQIAFDRDKKISGLYFRPVTTEFSYTLPSYANPDLYVEEDLFLEVPQGQLPATFTRPGFIDKFPVVIFIHGSGPNDRDQSIGPNKPFKDLAIGLATQGIASFRYDKKTKIYPEYYQEIINELTVEEEVLEDATAAIRFVSRMKGVDRSQIYILGHSLGGMLAPRIADENRRVDGLIIMAGNARPLEDLILHQANYLSGLENVTDNERESLNSMRIQALQLKNRNYTAVDPTSDYLLNLPETYWRDLSEYDQVEVAADLKIPMLFLQGGRDYQVPVEDFDLWRNALAARENTAFQFYPQLNHLFIEGDGLSTPQEYFIPGHVPENVIIDIARWIKLDK